ncbi:hypothetical protein CEY12_20775 [Chryseobacterium sp. T16E-39]|nr:hypothetical protein CEY12_20775 [Chryseobacterium sp. T16E-39]
MEKFKKKIDSNMHQLEKRWNSLSNKRQRTLTKLLLVVYFLLTVITVMYLWSGKCGSLSINHIDGIPKSTTLKNAVP